MKTIKFRAWHKKNKQMLYEGWNENIFITKESIFRYGDDVDIMQFTGLHDKNGKEIYEGDVCKREWESGFLSVGKKRDYWEIVYNNGSFLTKQINRPINQFSQRFSEMEIIGNIYQNPDLLTK